MVANKQTFQEDSSVPLSACQTTKPYFNVAGENRPTVDGEPKKEKRKKKSCIKIRIFDINPKKQKEQEFVCLL